ncbi:MAG TPA: hypothetical protein VLL05_12505 [Terriglobales bacterium]|nr:hypothetical protein [Terriglobales bacterium]
MVDKRPQSGFAHFTLSYVLRYAGLQREAAKECQTAMRLDPGNYQFRSCASVFFSQGRYDEGRAFLKLDAGSEWSNNVEVQALLREGRITEALEQLRKLPHSTFFHSSVLAACYTTPRPPDADQLLSQAEKEVVTFRDPEPRYSFAVVYNHCMGNAFTTRLLKSAIDGGFCAYENLQFDPLLKEFRKSPEYPPILAQAKQCQDHFMAQRDQPQH